MVKKRSSTKKKTTLALAPLTTQDAFKSAALLVSLLINLTVLIVWLIVKLSNKYDEQIFNFIFN